MISVKDKKFVAHRANYCCEYCQSQQRYAAVPFSVEHIIPVSTGGSDRPNNLALACQGCNNHKYNHTHALDPISGDNVSLFHPRKMMWKDHFAWLDDFTWIIGLTPTGRATVEKLRLNREGLVNLRSVLVLVNRHPPVH